MSPSLAVRSTSILPISGSIGALTCGGNLASGALCSAGVIRLIHQETRS